MQNHIKLVSFFHILFITINYAAAGSRCNDTGNFIANSTYANNRRQILSSLAHSVSTNGRFFNTTMGQDPDKVYALGLCRGDQSSESCFSCVNSTIQNLTTDCPNQKEALYWQEEYICLVRYVNRNFFGQLDLDPSESGSDENDLSYPNMTEFNQTLDALMESLINRASSSRIKYATEEAELKLGGSRVIYALMQCTPDLSQSDCRKCLNENVIAYDRCCRQKRGGYYRRPNCFSRWDLYSFYGASPSPPGSPLSPPAPPLGNSPPAPPPGNSPPPNTTNPKGGIGPGKIAAIVVSTFTFMAFVALTSIFLIRRRRNQDAKSKQDLESEQDTESKQDSQIEIEKCLQFDLRTIRDATDDFAAANRLAQGGFGAVYKGTLPDRQNVAVKRLSINSRQGEVEFKNEVKLMSRLEHRNLVRLLGFCCEESERLLIYEFVQNSSLNRYISDPTKRASLNWEICYRIIGGIARGLLYLHEDSRLRIIHRDLKASNIMLDEEMCPKISDFGLAKLFEMDQTHDIASRVVGTYGYMAPEYVLHGQVYIKFDVYSFGVLVLEIISGQMIGRFSGGEEAESLLTYAWRNWNAGTMSNLIDPTLVTGSEGEMKKCIHIGLLCVQENVLSRPTMASVVLMLGGSSVSLPAPLRPRFFPGTSMES